VSIAVALLRIYAKETSDEDIRTLWAKALAGELLQPGKFSLRLLHTINLLRKSDAQEFATFCNHVWIDLTGRRFFMYRVNPDDDDETLHVNARNRYVDHLAELGLVVNRSLRERLRSSQLDFVCYCGKAYSFMGWNVGDNPPELIRLTSLGEELMSLCVLVPDSEYLMDLAGASEVQPPLDPWPWPGVPQAS